jgi:predicted MPP superfamily phosphohydrolase
LIVEDDADIIKEVPSRFLRALPDLVILTIVVSAQVVGALWILRRFAANSSVWIRRAIWGGAGLSIGALTFGFLLRFMRIAQYFPAWWPSWGRGLVIMWAMVSVMWLGALVIWHYVRRLPLAAEQLRNPSRRAFLYTAQTTLFAAPVALVGYGTFIQRKNLQLREQRIVAPNLPEGLDGIRIVQLTDIHRSPFLSRAQLDWAVQMANETRPHLAIVTGDLITSGRDPLDDCIASLASLRTDAGIFGCLGNHEIYAGAEDHAEVEAARKGIRFLRMASRELRFGGASLNLAGVDYQTFRRPYLRGAQKLIKPGAFNVLLSHNPDVFPVAARQGYGLTIAGHTHGGQVRVEILQADLNIARVFTPYVDGLYSENSSSIFVSRGIGTIGMPTRIGAPPEVALIHLCRT